MLDGWVFHPLGAGGTGRSHAYLPANADWQPPAISTGLPQYILDRLGMFGDDSQQHARGYVGARPALLPVSEGDRRETELGRELRIPTMEDGAAGQCRSSPGKSTAIGGLMPDADGRALLPRMTSKSRTPRN